MIGRSSLFTSGAGKDRFWAAFFFFRQISIFHCEIASADEAEFSNFLRTAEHPIPNSNPHEPYSSVIHSPRGLEIKLR